MSSSCLSSTSCEIFKRYDLKFDLSFSLYGGVRLLKHVLNVYEITRYSQHMCDLYFYINIM
jgi:hypothetical protein